MNEDAQKKVHGYLDHLRKTKIEESKAILEERSILRCINLYERARNRCKKESSDEYYGDSYYIFRNSLRKA